MFVSKLVATLAVLTASAIVPAAAGAAPSPARSAAAAPGTQVGSEHADGIIAVLIGL